MGPRMKIREIILVNRQGKSTMMNKMSSKEKEKGAKELEN